MDFPAFAFNSADFQNLIVIINFFVLFIIFLYAFYLYSIEKKIRAKYKDLQSRVADIITEANKKSIEILSKSDYMSSNLRNEVTANFERILADLKHQSRDFYADVSKTYEKVSNDFVADVKDQNEKEIQEFGDTLKTEAKSIEKEYDKKLTADYEIARAEIIEYKKKRLKELDAELSAKVAEFSKKVLPEYIPEDSQERLVRDILKNLEGNSPNENDSTN